MVEKERIEESLNIEIISADLNDLEGYIEDFTNFIPIPLITLNPALKIIDMNTSFLIATGYAQYEILSMTIDLLFKDKQDIDNIITKTLEAGSIKNYETIISTKEKKEINVSVTCVLRTDEKGSLIGYFIAFIDVTDLKLVEKSLHEKIDRLQKSELATLNIMDDLQHTIQALTVAESKINEKNKDLQKINTELMSAREELTILNRDLEKKVKERTADVEKLLKQKDEFIDQLGHDLKTPLTPLIILLPIIKEREQDPHLKELLEVISNNLYYMKNLVIKTLTLAQLNTPNITLSFQDKNLFEYVQDILTMDRPLFEGKQVIIENNIPKDTMVQADLIQIKELFDNLISNAVKYSQGNDVRLTLGATKQDKMILVSVKDSGIGLEPHQIQHVFDEFYKADSSRHDLESTGLGLSICRRIVEQHGGKMWVESLGKGEGSTFFFTLKSS
jgi:PAS domain S-box-containing protein